jgi:hypothetical protein
VRFQNGWLSLVPPVGDTEQFDDPLVHQAYGRARSELDNAGIPVHLDALYLVFRIAAETEQLNQLAGRVPWLDRIAIGFIDGEIDGIASSFGLICYANLPDQELTNEYVDTAGFAGQFGVDAGSYFPAVIRAGTRVPQVSITSPSAALATTWSKSTRTRSGGWLVPSHAVDSSCQVHFSDGSQGKVTESWGSCIDAVIVTPTSGADRSDLVQKTCVRGISPGTTVSVEDATGTIHTATILDVDVNLGVVRHSLFPIRFSYDWTTSSPGDSGALVTATPCGEPVGMHQGMFTWHPQSAAPTRHAYALCLYQLEDYGGLEVYR